MFLKVLFAPAEISLGGKDVGMAEHFFDGVDGYAAFLEDVRKGVAGFVGVELTLYADAFS